MDYYNEDSNSTKQRKTAYLRDAIIPAGMNLPERSAREPITAAKVVLEPSGITHVLLEQYCHSKVHFLGFFTPCLKLSFQQTQSCFKSMLTQ